MSDKGPVAEQSIQMEKIIRRRLMMILASAVLASKFMVLDPQFNGSPRSTPIF